MSLSFVFIDDIVFSLQENLRKIEIVTTSFFFLIFKTKKKKKSSSFFFFNLNYNRKIKIYLFLKF